MALSKLSLLCLDSSPFFKEDILNIREGVQELNKDRHKFGEFIYLYENYRKDPDKFYEYTRMSVKTFDYILQHIEVYLKQQMRSKRVVSNPQKLFLTLRYLAHGTSFKVLSHSYRLGRSTVGKIIYQTLDALCEALCPLHMSEPRRQDLQNISDDFFLKWQFPNCIGAIDEKHFGIMKSPNSRSECGGGNKKYLSLVLQAISDADYNFIAIEVGGKGRQSEGGNFHLPILNRLLADNRFNLPPPKNLPSSNVTLPHVLVGSEAYPLKTYLMRPYPSARLLDGEKKVFNKRLSRAKATIDCALGILTHKWRIFTKSLETNTKHAKLITRAACVLHNIVRHEVGNTDEDYKTYMNNLSNSKNKIKRSKRNNRASTGAIAIRDKYKKYFVNNPLDI